MILSSANPDTQFCKCVGIVTQTIVYSCRADMGRVLLKEPDIFLTQINATKPVKEPKRRKCYILGKSQVCPKGESVDVFGMAIPRSLITEKFPTIHCKHATCNKACYTQKAHNHHTSQTNQPTPPRQETFKRSFHRVRNGKAHYKIVDEDDEAQQESIPHEEGNDPDLELAKKLILETPQEKGEGEGDDADLERAIKLSLDPAFLPQGRAPVGGVTIRDPVSETTSKLHEVVARKGIVTEESSSSFPGINLSMKKRIPDQFIMLGKKLESENRAAAPKGEWSDDVGHVYSNFMSKPFLYQTLNKHMRLWLDQTLSPEKKDQTAYPKVHENLKQITDERVIDDKPESHSGSIEESESTIPDPNQTVTSTPPVIAPFTDVTSSKPSRTKLDDALPRFLKRHNTYLIENTSVLLAQSLSDQESEKSPKEIIRAKKEQGREKDSTYSIKVNYEDAMDKEVATQLKTTRESMIISDTRDAVLTIQCTDLDPESGTFLTIFKMYFPIKDEGKTTEYRGPLITLTFPRRLQKEEILDIGSFINGYAVELERSDKERRMSLILSRSKPLVTLDSALRISSIIVGLRVNANMTSVRSMDTMVMGRGQEYGKKLDPWFKDFHLFEYLIGPWRNRNVVEVTREGSKVLHSLASRKDLESEGSTKSRNALLEEE
ncbi:hypothetical protein Tco_0569132 [Tanacetum coccineum]